MKGQHQEQNKLHWNLQIGGYSRDGLINKLRDAGCHVGYEAEVMIRRKEFHIASSIQEVELEVHSPSDFGIEEDSSIEQIQARALIHGYDYCPAEAVVPLRIAYRQQPGDERLSVFMEPIKDHNGYPSIFVLDNEGETGYPDLWLASEWVIPGRETNNDVFPSDWNFVFCRRQIKESSS